MRTALLCLAVLAATPSAAAAQSSSPTLLPLGSLRLAPGAGAYAAPQGSFEFDFDLAAGFRLGMFFDRLLVTPLVEIGYSYHSGGQALGEGSYFTVGGGVSVGTLEIAAALVPTYIVGDSRGETVHGFRTAARVEFFVGIWSLEIAHEWRSVRATDVHSIHITIGLDLGIAASAIINWMTSSRPRPEPEPEPPVEQEIAGP